MTHRLSFGALLGGALLAVFLVLFGPGGYPAPYVALLLAFIAIPYVIATRAGHGLVPDATGAAFLAAMGLLTLAFALAAHQPSDVLAIANFIWLALFIPMQALFKRLAGPRAAVVVARLALAGAAATLLVAGYEQLAFNSARVGRLTSDPIRIANTAVILGFLSLIGIMADTGRRRFIYLAGPLLAIGVALLAETRGAMVASGALAVVAIFIFVRRRGLAALIALGVGALAIAAIFVAAQFRIARADALVSAIGNVLAGAPIADLSSMVRFEMLRLSWPAFLDSPWYGHGWQRLMTTVGAYLPPGQEHLFRGQPHLHNDLADFAVGAGLLGVAAYLIILVTPLVAAWRSARDSLYHARLGGIVLVVAAYAVLGINSLMFGFEVHTALYFGLCAILLGFCRETAATEAAREVPAAPAGWAGRPVAGLLLVLALVVPTVLGLITPYVIVAIGLGLWLVLLFRGWLPASYAMPVARTLLIVFAVLLVLFTLTMRGWQDPLRAFNFTMLALYGPIAWLLARAAADWPPGRVACLASLGIALTLVMIVAVDLMLPGRPRGINLGPIVLANAALALSVVATAGALALRNRVSLLLPLSIIAAIGIILLTRSRGPLVAVLPLLALTGIMLWQVRLRRHWLAALGGAGIVAIGTITAVAFAGGRLAALPQIVAGLFGSGDIADRTTNNRLALYDAGWQAFLESPWIGHGWARRMTATLPHIDPAYLETARQITQLHNDVLNFAVSGGLVGVAAYLAIITAPTLAAWRSPRDALWAARVYGTMGLPIVYIGAGLTDLMFGYEFHTAFYVMLNAIVLTLFRERRAPA